MDLPPVASGQLLPTVLYLDDEAANRETFKAAFRRWFNVLVAADMPQAMAVLEHHEVHVLISDQRMPGTSGNEVLRQARERFPKVRRMLISAYADLQVLMDALNQAAVCHYVQKPWEVSDVLSAVQAAWDAYREESERSAYTEQLLESNRQLEFALRQSLLS